MNPVTEEREMSQGERKNTKKNKEKQMEKIKDGAVDFDLRKKQNLKLFPSQILELPKNLKTKQYLLCMQRRKLDRTLTGLDSNSFSIN